MPKSRPQSVQIDTPAGNHNSTAPAPQGDAETSIAQLRELVATFVSERKWEKFHDAKNLSMALTIEASELMEHFQWLTSEQVADGQAYDRQAVSDELADVTCYALAIANALDIDLSSAIVKKMADNRRKYPIEPR